MNKKTQNAQLNKGETRQLCGLAGQLNWVVSLTKPDASYSACEIIVSVKNDTVSDLIQAKTKIYKKLNQIRCP